jgi:hypothetical protein
VNFRKHDGIGWAHVDKIQSLSTPVNRNRSSRSMGCELLLFA